TPSTPSSCRGGSSGGRSTCMSRGTHELTRRSTNHGERTGRFRSGHRGADRGLLEAIAGHATRGPPPGARPVRRGDLAERTSVEQGRVLPEARGAADAVRRGRGALDGPVRADRARAGPGPAA